MGGAGSGLCVGGDGWIAVGGRSMTRPRMLGRSPGRVTGVTREKKKRGGKVSCRFYDRLISPIKAT